MGLPCAGRIETVPELTRHGLPLNPLTRPGSTSHPRPRLHPRLPPAPSGRPIRPSIAPRSCRRARRTDRAVCFDALAEHDPVADRCQEPCATQAAETACLPSNSSRSNAHKITSRSKRPECSRSQSDRPVLAQHTRFPVDRCGPRSQSRQSLTGALKPLGPYSRRRRRCAESGVGR